MKKFIRSFKSPTEFCVLLLLFLIALYFFIGAFSFSAKARAYPLVTSSATMIFIVLYCVETVLKNSKNVDAAVVDWEKMESSSFRTIGITIICFIAYLILTYLIGFLFSSVAMAVVYPLLYNYRKPLYVVLCGILAAVIVLCLQSFLSIPLCRGILIDLTPLFF
jgi:hypothetical protein